MLICDMHIRLEIHVFIQNGLANYLPHLDSLRLEQNPSVNLS